MLRIAFDANEYTFVLLCFLACQLKVNGLTWRTVAALLGVDLLEKIARNKKERGHLLVLKVHILSSKSENTAESVKLAKEAIAEFQRAGFSLDENLSSSLVWMMWQAAEKLLEVSAFAFCFAFVSVCCFAFAFVCCFFVWLIIFPNPHGSQLQQRGDALFWYRQCSFLLDLHSEDGGERANRTCLFRWRK